MINIYSIFNKLMKKYTLELSILKANWWLFNLSFIYL